MTETQKEETQDRLVDVTEKVSSIIQERMEMGSGFLLDNLIKSTIHFPAPPRNDVELVLTFKTLAMEEAYGLSRLFQMENVVFFGTPSGSYSGVVEMSGYVDSETVSELEVGI